MADDDSSEVITSQTPGPQQLAPSQPAPQPAASPQPTAPRPSPPQSSPPTGGSSPEKGVAASSSTTSPSTQRPASPGNQTAPASKPAVVPLVPKSAALTYLAKKLEPQMAWFDKRAQRSKLFHYMFFGASFVATSLSAPPLSKSRGPSGAASQLPP